MIKLYTPDQVAQMLQVSTSTIKRWLLSGTLQGIKLGPGGHWRIRSDVLNDFVQKGMKQNGQ